MLALFVKPKKQTNVSKLIATLNCLNVQAALSQYSNMCMHITGGLTIYHPIDGRMMKYWNSSPEIWQDSSDCY